MSHEFRTISAADAHNAASDMGKKMTDAANGAAEGVTQAANAATAKLYEGAAAAADSIGSASATATKALSGAAQSASDALQSASSRVADAASGAASTLTDQAAGAKRAGADAVAGLASGVRGMADTIEDQSPRVAGMVRSAADGADALSRQIRDGDFNDLVTAVTDFTRRRPGIALACGVIAGIAITRLFRASSNT